MARTGVLQGTLDLMILSVLAAGPLHGYSIARRIERLTDDLLRVEEGSLYPALHRMQARRWIRGEWAMTETGRRARFYRLTERGSKHLEEERREWHLLSNALSRVLDAGLLSART